jgi:galactokinase
MDSKDLAGKFIEKFGGEPKIFSAPGRVNLIGEHTDYNDGFVMPSAIGLRTLVAIAPRPDSRLRVESEDFPDSFEFDADNLPKQAAGSWSDYVVGVADRLQRLGIHPGGANILIQSDIPIGSGLSSSAAIEVATAIALLHLAGSTLPPPEIARLCQDAENIFIGAHVGIMDQFVSCLGKANHALLLDCRSLNFNLIPITSDVKLVICNTMVKHQHAGGEYNLRRRECEEGVKLYRHWYPEIGALRDLSFDHLSAHSKQVPQVIYKRCLHVVQENQRVQDAGQCLRRGDLQGFGKLMAESHRSLRDLYEVSCRELDVMVNLADGLPGYYGGRMTGGGFGGCTINLVAESKAKLFAEKISSRYRQAEGVQPAVYICSAADGARAEVNHSPDN